MSFDFSTLITDRSQSDVETARELTTRVENGLATAEEIARWNLAAEKGAYNYTDLNRVTACMDYLNERLTAAGYVTGYQRIVVHPPEPPKPEGPLPDGYAQLEYIEKSGSPFINTDFIPDSLSKISMQIAAFSYSDWSAPFGSRDTNHSDDSTSSTLFLSPQSIPRWDYYGASSTFQESIPLGKKIIIDLDKNSISIGGYTHTFNSIMASSNYPWYLLDVNTAGIPRGSGHFRLYSCQIYDDGLLVRDYIPCKNQSGKIGLFDLVNKTFYENAGSGAFISGPEVVQPDVPEQTESDIDPYTWYESDAPTQAQMRRYLDNVCRMNETLELPNDTPQTPESMNGLTQTEANNIEDILLVIQAYLVAMQKISLRSGMAWAVSGGSNFYFAN